MTAVFLSAFSHSTTLRFSEHRHDTIPVPDKKLAAGQALPGLRSKEAMFL
jgi:hypothetical protein